MSIILNAKQFYSSIYHEDILPFLGGSYFDPPIFRLLKEQRKSLESRHSLMDDRIGQLLVKKRFRLWWLEIRLCCSMVKAFFTSSL